MGPKTVTGGAQAHVSGAAHPCAGSVTRQGRGTEPHLTQPLRWGPVQRWDPSISRDSWGRGRQLVAQEVAGASVGGSGSTQQGQLAGTWVREGFLEEAAFGISPVVGGSEAEGGDGEPDVLGERKNAAQGCRSRKVGAGQGSLPLRLCVGEQGLLSVAPPGGRPEPRVLRPRAGAHQPCPTLLVWTASWTFGTEEIVNRGGYILEPLWLGEPRPSPAPDGAPA